MDYLFLKEFLVRCFDSRRVSYLEDNQFLKAQTCLAWCFQEISFFLDETAGAFKIILLHIANWLMKTNQLHWQV